MRRQRILGPDDSRAPKRRTAHGLTADERDYLAELQGYRCAICGRAGLPLELDHDHRHCPDATGCRQCVRGLLCGRCNAGLGLIGDALIPRLMVYLGHR